MDKIKLNKRIYYDWVCPGCNTLNEELDFLEEVECQECGQIWPVKNEES